MKKIYFLISALALTAGLNAQTANRNLNGNVHVKPIAQTNQIVTSIQSTTTTVLVPASIMACPSEQYAITVGTGTAYVGYLAGTNDYGDLQKAQKYSLSTYTLTTPASVSMVNAYIPYKTGGGTITAKVYADNSGNVGALLGTSSTVSVSSINTSSLTTFNFASAVNLTTSTFYVSVDFSSTNAANGDTIAIASTYTCAANGSGAYEEQGNNTWYNFTDANSWGPSANMDLYIFPTVTANTVGIKENSQAVSFLSLFPNPAKNDLNISYTLSSATTVYVSIMDVTGKMVKEVAGENMSSGDHSVKVDISTLEAGVYMCNVKTANGTSHSKFVVTK